MFNKKLLLLLGSTLIIGVIWFMFHPFNSDASNKLKYETHEKSERNAPYERALQEWKMLRNPATNEIPFNIREKELQFAKSIQTAEKKVATMTEPLSKAFNLSNWESIGPNNIGGRTRALAYDISDNTFNTILAAGISGGMWKTTDGGTSWNRTTTLQQLAAVSCVVQDTRTGNQNVWYYGTGEGPNLTSADGGGNAYYRGNGIFKSTDDGNSWVQLAATANDGISNGPLNLVYRIATDPSNVSQDEVYAATKGSIMRSLDGGNTWQTVLGDSSSGSFSDLSITSTGVVYATIGQDANQDGGIWRSPTGNKGDWANITPSSWPSTYTRIVLAMAPSNENVVYFYGVTPGSGKNGNSLWKYTYPGSGSGVGDGNWSDRSAAIPSGFDTQGSYDQLVAVKPDNSDFVLIGGVNLVRSTNGFADSTTNTVIGGTGNSPTGDYPGHFPDQHRIKFNPGNSNVLLSGNDGGVFKTDDVTAGTVTWTELNNGYLTTQYYGIAIDNGSTSKIVTGGMQDRGNWFINPDNSHNGYSMDDYGFDGTFDAIADNGAFYYSASQNGGLNRANFDANGNKSNSANITPQGASGQLFVNPYILDLANTDIMYYPAGGSIWRSNSVSTATSSSGWTGLTNSMLSNATITAISVSQANNAHVVYYGTEGGAIYRLDGADSGDPNNVDISTGKGLPSGAYVSCLAVDKTNSNNVIVVFSNYGVVSLYYTNDAGSSWTNISGSLEQNPDGSGDGPSCRWASIMHYNGVTYYYVSTSTGVYSTNNISNGPSTVWSQEGASTIGNVVCPMVLTRDSDGFVAVGTHGNGAFIAKAAVTALENDNNIPDNYSLLQNYPNPFNPSTNIVFTLPSSGNVILSIYDITGKLIKHLVNNQMSAGEHTINFDASELASGTYIYRIQTGNFVKSRKMLLLK